MSAERLLFKSVYRKAACIIAVLIGAGCLGLLNACHRSSVATLKSAPTFKNSEPSVASTTENLQFNPQQRIEFYQGALQQAQIALRSEDVAALQQRLAQLQLQQGENLLDESADNPQNSALMLQQTIQLMQQWLAKQEAEAVQANAQAEMRYLLARALDMQGQHAQAMQQLTELIQRYPQHKLSQEAAFRLAEDAYSRSDYINALRYYQQVGNFPADLSTQTNTPSALPLNADYMAGWSLFKLNQYSAALKPLDKVLSTSASTIQNREQGLREDTLRIMAVIISSLQGTQTLKDFYPEPLPAWAVEVYLALANYYQRDQRFLDAASVYADFQRDHPKSAQAYQFQVKLIELLEAQQQFADARAAKAEFVQRYASNTAREVRDVLSGYLLLLAQYHHHQAQSAADIKSSDWAQAIRYYQQWLSIFPQDKQASKQQFLLAEAYFETQQWPQAIDLYQQLAPQSAQAANALMASYSQLLVSPSFLTLPDPEKMRWQEQALQQAQLYSTAVESAHSSTQEAARGLTQQALSLKADDLYQKQQFAEACGLYQQLLRDFAKAEAAAVWRQQLANGLYQQAKQQVQTNHSNGPNWQVAIDLLLQIPPLSADVQLARAAQLDAATYQIQLQQWDKAIALLKKIRDQYPETTTQVAEKLAFIYTQQANPLATADELMRLANANSNQQNNQQAALLKAAVIYQQQQKIPQAIAAYQQYAQTYPEPVDEQIAAIRELIVLQPNNLAQQTHWRQQLIARDNQTENATSASRQAAAEASLVLSEQALAKFVQTPLTLPLDQSFARKQQLMQQTIAACKQTLSYADPAVQAAATAQMAEIFQQFSSSLLTSPRPPDLSELELEEYNLLLEEQAYPFEEQAIEWHERNMQRMHQGLWSAGIETSLLRLQQLLPAKYLRPERSGGGVADAHP